MKLGGGLSGLGKEQAEGQVDRPSLRRAGHRSTRPERELGVLTLAASDSCTSSTDSAKQDRLSMEPSRRRPPHRVAIAAGPAGPTARSPGAPAPGSGSGSGSGSGCGSRSAACTSVWAFASPAAPEQLPRASAPETVPGAKGPETTPSGAGPSYSRALESKVSYRGAPATSSKQSVEG